MSSSPLSLEKKFKQALKKPLEKRTPQETDLIFAYLHSLDALSNLREQTLRSLCSSVRLEYRDANDILYCRGELCTCWYILLSGSVFIDGSMFLPRTSFGKRCGGCVRRSNECLILESSEMIAIDYPDVQLMKPSKRISSVSTTQSSRSSTPLHPAGQMAGSNLEQVLALDPVDKRMGRGRYHSDSSFELPSDLQNRPNIQPRINPGMYGMRIDQPGNSGIGIMVGTEEHVSTEDSAPGSPSILSLQYHRNSRSSDTSSAYSGSDVMQSSTDDTEVDVNSLTLEVVVDSDDEDEEGYVEANESLIVRDTVRECLEKEPSERTEDDIEALLEFMQHFPAFANMTLVTRRSLCSVMVFAVVDKAETIVMNDGEELDSWSVILNGHVEIERPDGSIEHLHMGDSFGITPTMEKLYHKGVMKTKVDDCQFVCIAQSDYYKILHQGEENTKRHKEEGEVVLVTEHRTLDSGSRNGHVVIRGTPDQLMLQLVKESSSVDPTYVEDLLLTYRTFLKTPLLITEKLLIWFSQTDLTAKVTRVVLLWVNNHFNDFETSTDMCEFLEKFETCLDSQNMGGQLRLLNIACAAKARPRTVVLTRATREEILYFSVLGGIERGCGIFISKVEASSKASEAGLKRGDQILEVNNHNFEHISHTRALEILRGTTHLSIIVKSNLLDLKKCFSEMLLSPENSPRTTSKKKKVPTATLR